MNVFVVNKHGRPLMPTSPRKARLFLKEGKAKIHSRDPLTIQLIHGSSGYIQPTVLGIDAGYHKVGFSACNETHELIGGELALLKGMSSRLAERRMYRRARRNRKKHRPPRFDNRRRPEGWLPPSIQHKLDSHHKLIDRIKAILPVERVVVEVASFDIHKLKNPDIRGREYQQGEQYGFDNLRAYILHRDHYTCQHPACTNKAKQPILQVHHLGYWKDDRSNRPGNLIALCSRCHTPRAHQPSGKLYGWQPALKSYRGETFMTIVYQRLVAEGNYTMTYGYLTKARRTEWELEKSHHNDAFVIAAGSDQTRTQPLYLEQLRRNKRSLELFYDAKYQDTRDGQVKSGQELASGRRTRDTSKNGPNLRVYRGHKVRLGRRAVKRRRYPYQPHDLVVYQGRTFCVRGMHCQGTRLILHETGKSVKVEQVKAKKRRSGMCEALRA